MDPKSTGFDIYRDEEVSCCSDHDCKAIEMGAGDEHITEVVNFSILKIQKLFLEGKNHV